MERKKRMIDVSRCHSKQKMIIMGESLVIKYTGIMNVSLILVLSKHTIL